MVVPGICRAISFISRQPRLDLGKSGATYHTASPRTALSTVSREASMVFPQRLPQANTLKRAGLSFTSAWPSCSGISKVTLRIGISSTSSAPLDHYLNRLVWHSSKLPTLHIATPLAYGLKGKDDGGSIAFVDLLL